MQEFDVIVIGAGAAGLVSSSFAAGLGLKVALVSDGHPGGECLWSGCVPSKALIHSAHIAHTLRTQGIKDLESFNAGFPHAMDFMKQKRQLISHHDSVESVEKSGVHVITGRASFINAYTVKVNDSILAAKKFILATGGSQRFPKKTGLYEAGALTHETILELQEKPEHLVIIGAGPVGVEYAQTMVRLGVRVTLIDRNPVPLSREEPETSEFVLSVLKSEGVQFMQAINGDLRASVGDKKRTVLFTGNDGPVTLTCDEILMATGKTPNTEDLNLAAAGVETTELGFIKVDEHQRTTSRHIFACGDVCGGYQFTHFADHQARIAVMNACLNIRARREQRVVPWCTFVDPEIASVGLREAEARRRFGSEKIFVLKYSLADFDRTILDNKASGFIKVVTDRRGTIHGVSIAGERAGELIHEFALAMKVNQPIQALGGLIHVYPTVSGAIRNVANLYYRTIMKDSWQSKLVKWWAKLNAGKIDVSCLSESKADKSKLHREHVLESPYVAASCEKEDKNSRQSQ